MRRKLEDLNLDVENAVPIGKPKLFSLNTADVGINYCSDNYVLSDFQREQVYFAFMPKILREAPSKANGFSCSDMDIEDNGNWQEAYIAVQYYKIKKSQQ